MKRSLFLAIVLAALAMAMPAFATPLTLTFASDPIPYGSPGFAGDYGLVNIFSSTTATGYNIAITKLIVSGDGAYDGVYAVTGTVFNQYGDLDFGTSPGSQYVTIVGGVLGLGVANGTTLLTGTGGSNGFTNLLVSQVPPPSGFPGFYSAFNISFTTPDTKAPALLSALGIPGTQWELATIDIAAGSGNNFPEYSVNAMNTAVPEPGTMMLLGAGFLGLAVYGKRRKSA